MDIGAVERGKGLVLNVYVADKWDVLNDLVLAFGVAFKVVTGLVCEGSPGE